MKRIMILDSSSVVRKVAKRILASDDYVIVEAETGAMALESCKVDMPQIILCDQMLSDMTAVEFISEITELAGDDPPKVYLNLHEMDLVAIMRSKRAGASGFVMKPFTRRLLLERFRQLGEAA